MTDPQPSAPTEVPTNGNSAAAAATEITPTGDTKVGAPATKDAGRVLTLDDLRTTFTTLRGNVQAVRGITFGLAPGETLGIVGESGSGKSALARTLMGLYDDTPGITITGDVEFNGIDVSKLTRKERQKIWGNDIAMIFQDPMTALNPVKKIGAHLREPLRYHLDLNRSQAKARSVELLNEVGIPEPERRLNQYPHELSGGMRQRVCIALALSCRPKLLIADEPTTALDVTVQREILDLLDTVAVQTDMTTILITHDLGVVAKQATRILVMYGGQIMEKAPTRDLFHFTRHPYTRALLEAMPRLSQPSHTRMLAIGGRPPDLTNPPVGCPFAPRCSHAQDKCIAENPPLRSLADDSRLHSVACHFPVGTPEGDAALKANQEAGTTAAGTVLAKLEVM